MGWISRLLSKVIRKKPKQKSIVRNEEKVLPPQKQYDFTQIGTYENGNISDEDICTILGSSSELRGENDNYSAEEIKAISGDEAAFLRMTDQEQQKMADQVPPFDRKDGFKFHVIVTPSGKRKAVFICQCSECQKRF